VGEDKVRGHFLLFGDIFRALLLECVVRTLSSVLILRLYPKIVFLTGNTEDKSPIYLSNSNQPSSRITRNSA
jgi:hypothetical protein